MKKYGLALRQPVHHTADKLSKLLIKHDNFHKESCVVSNIYIRMKKSLLICGIAFYTDIFYTKYMLKPMRAKSFQQITHKTLSIFWEAI